MKDKNVKELSNSELNVYKKDLENEYESIKNEINNLCDELRKVEKKYYSVELEFKIRKNSIY